MIFLRPQPYTFTMQSELTQWTNPASLCLCVLCGRWWGQGASGHTTSVNQYPFLRISLLWIASLLARGGTEKRHTEALHFCMAAAIMFLIAWAQKHKLRLSLGKLEVTLEALQVLLRWRWIGWWRLVFFNAIFLKSQTECKRGAVCCAPPLNPARAILSCTGLILTLPVSYSSNLLFLTSNSKNKQFVYLVMNRTYLEARMTYMEVNTEGMDGGCVCHLRP